MKTTIANNGEAGAKAAGLMRVEKARSMLSVTGMLCISGSMCRCRLRLVLGGEEDYSVDVVTGGK